MSREEQAQYIAEKLMEDPEFKKAFVGAITDAVNGAVKAIKALQQELCIDCISRQAAIDACLNGWNKDYKEIVEEIRALPPVTPVEKVRQSFEGMTNGEVIQALFPKIKVKPLVGVKGLLHVFFDKKEDNAFDEDWWNAPYKGGAE